MRPPTQFGVGFKRFFKFNSSPESSVQIIKRPYFIALKVLFVIAAIAFIVIGLLMIDDSCGCVRSQDKLMMLMLKVHVGLGILMLVVSLGMSQLYPRFGILFILLILLAILGIDGWIFNNYKRCVGNTDLVQSDKRFLTWLVTTMIISGALSLTTLIIIGFLINRYGKGEVIKKSAIDFSTLTTEYEAVLAKIEKKLDEKSQAYRQKADKLKVIYPNDISIPKDKLLDIIPMIKVHEKLNEKLREPYANTELIENDRRDMNSLAASFDSYLRHKRELSKKYEESIKACQSTFGLVPDEAKCAKAQNELRKEIESISKEKFSAGQVSNTQNQGYKRI